MYSPTTRLLTVLELLQSYKEMSGAELARRLEVDRRTVRRYILTLQDMGIPVEAERGPYGAYQLQRGFKLPPLMFTDHEAIALTLGLMAIRELRFPVETAAIEGALAKTERVMPEKLLGQARALQESIQFNMNPAPVRLKSNYVVTFSTAVQQGLRLRVRYQSSQDDITERDFDPYGVVFQEGYWYAPGYCHLRKGLRTFRLDRVVLLLRTDETFTPPDDFDALQYVLESIASAPGAYEVEVLLDTDIETARNAIAPEYGLLEARPEGVLFRRRTPWITWIIYMLMELEFPILSINPPELREMLRATAEKLRRIADTP